MDKFAHIPDERRQSVAAMASIMDDGIGNVSAALVEQGGCMYHAADRQRLRTCVDIVIIMRRLLTAVRHIAGIQWCRNAFATL